MGVLDQFRLDGKVALVTGAARGLGQALAVGLAQAGADVAVLDILPMPETAEAIAREGRQCQAIPCNLRDATPAELEDVVGSAEERFGRLDILVNNAGIIRRSTSLEYKASDWQDVVQINLNAVFYLSQAAGRVMAAQGGGKIINISSVLAFQGGFLVPSYAATKHAVAGLTQALANEWAPLNINVNALALGYLETELTSAIRSDSDRSAQLLARVPAGRYGRPGDIMGSVVYLASAASDYMHGAMVPVDGGWLAR